MKEDKKQDTQYTIGNYPKQSEGLQFVTVTGHIEPIAISSGAADDMLKRHEDKKQESLRFNTGKIQTKEIDPDFVLGIGDVLTKSREKYPAFNWCKPTPFSVPYESMMRHLMAFQKGEEFDVESGKHHLLHVATNVMFLYYQLMNHPEMDDRGFKKEKK